MPDQDDPDQHNSDQPPFDKSLTTTSAPPQLPARLNNTPATGPSRRGGFLSWLRGFIRRSPREDRLRETIEEILTEQDLAPLTEDELAIDSSERTMLSNVLRLRELTAEDVAVPRADIIALEVTQPFEEILAILNDERHSRLPVYRDTLDNALGFIHLKDVLAFVDNREAFEFEKHIREPLFVSPSVSVSDLLLEMRVKRVHLALVVDEYGGVDGLVTIEDLVEQIVGEIDDEHDDSDEDPKMVEINGQWIVDARVPIEDFESRFGAILTEEERDEDVDTLGGLVVTLAGRVPTRGEVLIHASGLEMKVVDADPRRVTKLSISQGKGKLKPDDELKS